jgi:hypothetical protein
MPLNIEGRLFEPMNLRARTFRADAAQARLLGELGMDRSDIAPAEGEPMPDYLLRLNQRLLDTQRIPELLGHYLLPAGKTETDWTPDMARETAAFLEMVQTEESRRLLWELSAEFVFFFLRSNLARLAIFPSYSEPLDAMTDASSELAVSLSRTSATGRRSSDRWPRAAGLLPWLSRILRSARA